MRRPPSLPPSAPPAGPARSTWPMRGPRATEEWPRLSTIWAGCCGTPAPTPSLSAKVCVGLPRGSVGVLVLVLILVLSCLVLSCAGRRCWSFGRCVRGIVVEFLHFAHRLLERLISRCNGPCSSIDRSIDRDIETSKHRNLARSGQGRFGFSLVDVQF